MKEFDRRQTLGLGLAGLLAAGGSARAAAPEQASLEIGGNRDPQLGAHIALAVNKNLFKDEGLEVKVHWTQVSGDLQPLVAGGALNVAGFGMHSVVNLRARKVPLRAICALCEYSGTQGLVISPGKKLSGPADLMGKRIAAPNQAPHEMALAKLGKQHNFDHTKIVIVRMEPSKSIAAAARGDVDGVLTFQPHMYKLIQMGGTLYFTGRTSSISGKEEVLPLEDRLLYIHSVLSVNENWLAKNPNTAAALIRAMIRADAMLKNDATQAQAILSDFLRADPKSLRIAMQQNVYGLAIDAALKKSVDFANDWLGVNRQIPSPISPSETIAPAILRQIEPKLVSWEG